LTSDALAPTYDLPNLEIIAGEPPRIAANALPLIRQHAFEAYLGRSLRSIEKGGLLDPQTGLLTRAAFSRDLAAAVEQTLSHGGGLSIARFTFDPPRGRAQRDGGRIISRLMRKMDFGAVHEDGSIVVVFAQTDLRTAHSIARRLTSVMRHTSHDKGKSQSAPEVTVATMQPSDSVRSLLARLHEDGKREAS
jgi:PleD family two-component response regulator